IVRRQCAPDRTLVIVAGNSVFNGYGQPPGGIWTAHLGGELGPGYCVVNLATALSLIGDFGAVTTDMLRRDYPRGVLVGNTLPGSCGPPDGASAYRYLFWDAYWKGLLTAPEERRRAIEAVSAVRTRDSERELRLRMWLDARLRFNDLWTFVTYQWFSTVWT